MLPLPGLSSASGKPVVVKFDGGLLSWDGGVLALREVEQRLRVGDRLAACMIDPRAADRITHSLADVIRFRLLMISAGCEDGNDAHALRRDPMFKMAVDLSPSIGNCARSRQYRGWRICRTFAPCCGWAGRGRSVLRVLRHGSQTDHAGHRRHDGAHGGQQLRLFNAHYDEYGFQPIVVFDGEGRFVTAVLRPARRPSGKEIKPFLRRLLRAIRAHWPNTEILLRADSHYCGPEVLDWCRANGLDHRSRRSSGRGRTGHPLRRHQSEQTQRSRALRGCLLPARPKTISSPGRPIWRRIAGPAPGRQPNSDGSD